VKLVPSSGSWKTQCNKSKYEHGNKIVVLNMKTLSSPTQLKESPNEKKK
jgi:hypothetical protein